MVFLSSKGNALPQAVGSVVMFLAAAFFLIALVRVFEDVELIREIILKFRAFGIESLWFIAIILFAVGYYIFKSE